MLGLGLLAPKYARRLTPEQITFLLRCRAARSPVLRARRNPKGVTEEKEISLDEYLRIPGVFKTLYRPFSQANLRASDREEAHAATLSAVWLDARYGPMDENVVDLDARRRSDPQAERERQARVVGRGPKKTATAWAAVFSEVSAQQIKAHVKKQFTGEMTEASRAPSGFSASLESLLPTQANKMEIDNAVGHGHVEDSGIANAVWMFVNGNDDRRAGPLTPPLEGSEKIAVLMLYYNLLTDANNKDLSTLSHLPREYVMSLSATNRERARQLEAARAEFYGPSLPHGRFPVLQESADGYSPRDVEYIYNLNPNQIRLDIRRFASLVRDRTKSRKKAMKSAHQF